MAVMHGAYRYYTRYVDDCSIFNIIILTWNTILYNGDMEYNIRVRDLELFSIHSVVTGAICL